MNGGLNPIINLPYPKVNVVEKNPSFAYKLLDVYAGSVSEFTLIGQYSFQSIYLNEYKELSEIIQKIAMVEMKHLKILGILIEKLGLVPYYVTYQNNNPIPWSVDNIDFTTNYRDMLVDNIKEENLAIDDYRKLVNETNDQNIKDILNRIILDEERHVEIFTKLLNQYDEDQ